jgi:biopolymer transport protein ExbD
MRRHLEPMHDDHVNVTPLIDVIMCLIIFFLVCGRLAAQESNDKVVIPRATLGQEMSEQRDRFVINVVPNKTNADPTIEPSIFIRGQQIGINELAVYLQREKKDTPDLKVILRADQSVSYQWIAPILAACSQADIKSVNFSTKRPD